MEDLNTLLREATTELRRYMNTPEYALKQAEAQEKALVAEREARAKWVDEVSIVASPAGIVRWESDGTVCVIPKNPRMVIAVTF